MIREREKTNKEYGHVNKTGKMQDYTVPILSATVSTRSDPTLLNTVFQMPRTVPDTQKAFKKYLLNEGLQTRKYLIK